MSFGKHSYISFFLIVALIFAPFKASSQRGAHQFSVIKQLDILSNNTISSFYQSESGVMWINSNAGLIRFNGNRAEVIAYPLGMKPIVGCSDYILCSLNEGLLKINIRNNKQEVILKNAVGGENAHITINTNYLYVGQNNKIDIFEDTIYHNSLTLPDKEQVSNTTTTYDNETWIGTQQGNLYFIVNNTLKKIDANFQSEITTIFKDSKGRMWIGTLSDGVFVWYQGTIIARYSTSENENHRIKSNFIKSFCEDRVGQLWIATLDGVNVINQQTNKLVSFYIGQTNEKSVWALYPDRQGNIWVGTFYSGVYFFNASTATFFIYSTDKEISMVNRMVEDKRGDVWILTDGFGLYRHTKNGETRQITTEIKKTKTAWYDEENDKLWIGTYLEGLYTYSIASQQLKRITFANAHINKQILTVNDIVSIGRTLYIGTTNGIFGINLDNPDEITPVTSYNSLVHSLLVDKNHDLWIAGVGVYKYNLKEKTTQDILKDIEIKFPKDAQFKWAFEDRSGRIWVSALRYGLLLIDSIKPQLFTDQNAGLSDNFISTISQTPEGILLLGTNSGVSLFFPEKKRSIIYNSSNGFPLRSTRNGCVLHHSDGSILIGGTTGIASFSLNSSNIEQPKSIYFDRLRINNQNVDSLEGVSVDGLSLSYTKGITLNHLQKNIAIEVASTDFSHTQHTFYEYMLSGYDNTWTRFMLSTPIIYMNLKPGKYQLNIRAFSDIEMLDKIEISLPIYAKPPWYAAPFAQAIYIIFTLLLVFGIFYFFYSRLLFREQLKRQEESSRAKLRFFTNVSHEIRTPLTLITGNLEMLVNKSKQATVSTKDITSAYRNARKMQELVNELLDFEKQSLGYKQLKVSVREFNDFMQNIHASFQSYAEYRSIQFNLSLKTQEVVQCYDYTQLQKVFFNLLMNAFKHTQNGGKIELSISKDVLPNPESEADSSLAGNILRWLGVKRKNDGKQMLVVKVSDTGQGMSSKTLSQIFDPFYQNTTKLSHDKYNKGTGIGLSIAKKIIEQHHGFIKVESQLNQGTTFSVALPTDEYWYQNDSLIQKSESSELESFDDLIYIDDSSPQSPDESKKDSLEPHKNKASKKKILIVEDDDELLSLLESVFKPIFEVIKASDGAAAFELAQDQQPDIIVSDVMMPVMDGLELCSSIKGTLNTSHIPVVLLTARTTEDQTLEGICAGADDYVFKPFSIELLIAKCNALLHNREVLQQKYQHSISTSADTIVSNTQDALFLEKLVSVIEKHMSDEKMGVPFLCVQMAMSKTLLSNKIKGITDQSPAEFIQTLKLKRAAWMILNESQKSMADIAYELGFSSPGYFGIRFKKHFGKSPTDLKNEYPKQST